MASRVALEPGRHIPGHLRRLRRGRSDIRTGHLMSSRYDQEQIVEWLKEHRVGEVECLVADMAGIARGKILPPSKFLSAIRNRTLRLPESIFGQMVTGADAETETLTYQAPDMNLVPDA